MYNYFLLNKKWSRENNVINKFNTFNNASNIFVNILLCHIRFFKICEYIGLPINWNVYVCVR